MNFNFQHVCVLLTLQLSLTNIQLNEKILSVQIYIYTPFNRRICFNISCSKTNSSGYYCLYSTQDLREHANEHLMSVVTFSDRKDCQWRELRKEDKEPQGPIGDKSVFERKKISLRGCSESSEN